MKKLIGFAFVFFLVLGMSGICFGQVAKTQTHSIIAEKPLYLTDGQTGQSYTISQGFCTMNWQDRTRYGFFYAKAAVISPDSSAIPTIYDFTLVSISSSNPDSIEGLWDIRKNGVVAATGVVGKLYGLVSPVGYYFKLYAGDSQSNTMKWHFSAYVTARYDF